MQMFKDYVGEWYKVEQAEMNGKTYELWESEIYGSDAANLITEDGKVIIDDSYNGIAVDLGDYLDKEYCEINITWQL